jgi:hypothetical protein
MRVKFWRIAARRFGPQRIAIAILCIEKVTRLADKKPKFYVVWQGREPGVYSSWDACQKQISGFSGAKYKSFDTMAKAKVAFQQDADEHWGKGDGAPKKATTPVVDFQELSGLGVNMSAWCVDAACKGNPGQLEYHWRRQRSVFRLPFRSSCAWR